MEPFHTLIRSSLVPLLGLTFSGLLAITERVEDAVRVAQQVGSASTREWIFMVFLILALCWFLWDLSNRSRKQSEDDKKSVLKVVEQYALDAQGHRDMGGAIKQALDKLNESNHRVATAMIWCQQCNGLMTATEKHINDLFEKGLIDLPTRDRLISEISK